MYLGEIYKTFMTINIFNGLLVLQINYLLKIRFGNKIKTKYSRGKILCSLLQELDPKFSYLKGRRERTLKGG